MEEVVDRLIPRASFHGSLTGERLDEFRKKALDDLIEFELQYQYAVTKGMTPDRKAVKDRMKQIRDAFPSKRERGYKEWLKRVGRTEGELREMVEKENIVQAAWQQVVGTPATVSDQQLREYYEKNTEKFKSPETARLRIISTKDRLKADDALGRISKGEDFGDVAAKMSEDNYRIKGGDIGYVHRGRIYPELEQAAFALAAGEVSGPVAAEGRWFLVKLEERKSEHLIPFEDAREKLKKDLENKKRSELFEAWLAGLREKAVIERFLHSASTGT
jgi:peptidyl-prolyl cis-trans isomerase C